MKSGIYSITNTTNGKCYVGSSINVDRRMKCGHLHDLRHNKHPNSHLQRSWNKYGEKAFKFELLEEVPKEMLVEVEQQYLDLAKIMQPLYYNNNFDAAVPNRGNKHTAQTRKKISIRLQEAFKNGHANKLKEAWKHTNSVQRHVDDTTYSFRNRITGETFTGRQVDFYKKYNLNNAKVCCLIKGIRLAHKDWMLN